MRRGGVDLGQRETRLHRFLPDRRERDAPSLSPTRLHRKKTAADRRVHPRVERDDVVPTVPGLGAWMSGRLAVSIGDEVSPSNRGYAETLAANLRHGLVYLRHRRELNFEVPQVR
jgi:hypothetical protein